MYGKCIKIIIQLNLSKIMPPLDLNLMYTKVVELVERYLITANNFDIHLISVGTN